MKDRIRHQVHRDQETVQTRMFRVQIDKECHQLYLNKETGELANERREMHRELMNYYRRSENGEIENEEETEENILTEERNEEQELIRTMNAF